MAVTQWELCVSKWTRGEEPQWINIRQKPVLQLFLCFQRNHQEGTNTCLLSASPRGPVWTVKTTFCIKVAVARTADQGEGAGMKGATIPNLDGIVILK